MKAPRSSSSYEPIPAGSYVARCYSIIDLGTVQPKNPEFAASRKIKITWELPTELRPNNDPSPNSQMEKPATISKDFTLSMHERSRLRPTIEGWFGKKFPSNDSAYDFDVEKLLGKTCMLAVVNEEVGENIYSNISSISPLAKGMVCPDAINAEFFLSYEKWDENAFETLPQFIRDRMCNTPEFLEMRNPKTDPRTKPIETVVTADKPVLGQAATQAQMDTANRKIAADEEIDIEEIPF